tara:strand:- start:256 stop:495 length:240 start_codon:yes stop_codon:yes gene_type:complete
MLQVIAHATASTSKMVSHICSSHSPAQTWAMNKSGVNNINISNAFTHNIHYLTPESRGQPISNVTRRFTFKTYWDAADT